MVDLVVRKIFQGFYRSLNFHIFFFRVFEYFYDQYATHTAKEIIDNSESNLTPTSNRKFNVKNIPLSNFMNFNHRYNISLNNIVFSFKLNVKIAKVLSI